MWDLIRLCHCCRDPVVQLYLGQEYVKSLFKSSLLSSVECSSKMLITLNSRGIRGHAVLRKSCSLSCKTYFSSLSRSVYPSWPVSGAGCKPNKSLHAFGSLFAQNPMWRRTLPTCITQILIFNIQCWSVHPMNKNLLTLLCRYLCKMCWKKWWAELWCLETVQACVHVGKETETCFLACTSA